jgi:hypothetical protein
MFGNRVGEAIESLITKLIWVAIITVPFALWKIIEITLWLFNNVTVNIN